MEYIITPYVHPLQRIRGINLLKLPVLPLLESKPELCTDISGIGAVSTLSPSYSDILASN